MQVISYDSYTIKQMLQKNNYSFITYWYAQQIKLTVQPESQMIAIE